jgi:hypothetical protein
MQLRRKRFDRPDEIRTVEKARIELVELGELASDAPCSSQAGVGPNTSSRSLAPKAARFTTSARWYPGVCASR